MELHRYDIIEAELDYGSGSIQKKRRPYIIKKKENSFSIRYLNHNILNIFFISFIKKI